MIKPFLSLALILVSSLNLYSASKGGEMKHPDFTQGDEIPDGAEHDWNLGATGLRGWMYSDAMVTSDARQIKITKVAKGSPADGVVKVGDVVLGVNGALFSYDPRTEVGKALVASEGGDGVLGLICWRDGKKKLVELSLPVLGSYSATAPYDCAKSKKVFERGCEALAKRVASGERRRHPITRSLNGLALLASGDSKYLNLLKKEAQWAANLKDDGFKSWSYSYVLIFLSEYTMATGDKSVLPGLRRLALEAANGQSAAGSWGHKFVDQDGMLRGYGMMNSPGIPLTVGLVLAREAGVRDTVVSEAIEKSAKLVRFYHGKGAIPYGDHTPWMETHEDNGKCGSAAVLFDFLGEKEAANFFTKMSLASYGAERDGGHTGNFFNILWSMHGVALAGENATGAWMNEFGGWYSDLAREWDGDFVHQGPPSMRNDKYKGWDCTGLYLLHYAMPLKKIYLTGRKRRTVDAMDVSEARSVIEDGRGWTSKTKKSIYSDLSKKDLIERLGSWSPIVRDRAVRAFHKSKMGSGIVEEMVALLDSRDDNLRLGACQMLGKIRSADAVEPLRRCLKDDDLWIRVKAAEALASTGEAAMVALPELLEMLAKGPSKIDPRGMEQRYLNYALFDKMLKHSLDGVDRKLLHKAIIAGLKNDDGNSRGSVANIYKKLSYDEIKPLFPAIYAATEERAPSGVMFLAKVRMSGLELMAKHRMKEGIPLCFKVMDMEKWGKGNRISRCLNAIGQYGGAAKPLLPELRELGKYLEKQKDSGMVRSQRELFKKVMSKVESGVAPKLRSMK